jgi:hypothetical protein
MTAVVPDRLTMQGLFVPLHVVSAAPSEIVAPAVIDPTVPVPRIMV